MVFGSILNWIVGRTLDFTLDRIIWVTKTTALGIITLGYYITSRNTNKIKNEQDQILELIPLTKVEIEMLKKLNPKLAITFSEDLGEKINEETNVDSCIKENITSSEKKNNYDKDYDYDSDSDSFV